MADFTQKLKEIAERDAENFYKVYGSDIPEDFKKMLTEGNAFTYDDFVNYITKEKKYKKIGKKGDKYYYTDTNIPYGATSIEDSSHMITCENDGTVKTIPEAETSSVSNGGVVINNTNINPNEIVNIINNNGGKVETKPYYLTIFAIRNPNTVNKFDDKCCVIWYDSSNKLNSYCSTKGFTTKPGTYWLKNPMKPSGCAIVKEGWHNAIWVKGMHRKKYPALIQVNPIQGYRDNTKSGVIHYTNPINLGVTSIEMHRATDNGVSTSVDKWSAGCQVWASSDEFANFMGLVDKAISNGQKYFGYYLALQSNVNL